MGRNKIPIQKIQNERNRQATFTKRKTGLIKKAMELSILCDCEVALIICNNNSRMYHYSSGDISKIMTKFKEHEDSSMAMSNNDYNRIFSRSRDDSPGPSSSRPHRTRSVSSGPYALRNGYDDEEESEEEEDDDDEEIVSPRASRSRAKKRGPFASPAATKRRMTLKDSEEQDAPTLASVAAPNNAHPSPSNVQPINPKPNAHPTSVKDISMNIGFNPALLTGQPLMVHPQLTQDQMLPFLPTTDAMQGVTPTNPQDYFAHPVYNSRFVQNPYLPMYPAAYLPALPTAGGPNVSMLNATSNGPPRDSQEDSKKGDLSNSPLHPKKKSPGLSVTIPDKTRGPALTSPLTPTFLSTLHPLLHSPTLNPTHPGLFASHLGFPSPSPTTAPSSFGAFMTPPLALPDFSSSLLLQPNPVSNSALAQNSESTMNDISSNVKQEPM